MTEPRIQYKKTVAYIAPHVSPDVAHQIFEKYLWPRQITCSFNLVSALAGNFLEKELYVYGLHLERDDEEITKLHDEVEVKFPGSTIVFKREDGVTLLTKYTRGDIPPKTPLEKRRVRKYRLLWTGIPPGQRETLFLDSWTNGIDIGNKPDDAGVGDWKRNVIEAHGFSPEARDELKQWMKEHYPKAKLINGNLSPLEDIPVTKTITVTDEGKGEDSIKE
jgi:hypothetical protein